MSDVQNIQTPAEAVAADVNNTKAPGKFRRAMTTTGKGLRRASTDIGVWTTATVLTIAEPIVKLGEVVVHTADTKENQVRNFGRNFIETRHARLIKSSETEVQRLQRELAEAKAAVVAANADVVNNPAPEPGTSLRPLPAN